MKDRIKPESKELLATLIATIISHGGWRGTVRVEDAISQAAEQSMQIMDLVGIDWEIKEEVKEQKKRGPKPKPEESETTEPVTE